MSKSNAGKIILATVALILAVVSLVLVIIYASLAYDVIEYALRSEKENWEGLGAAVGLVLMIIIGSAIVVLAVVSLIMFLTSKSRSGAVGMIVKVTFIYQVSAAALAIIAFIIVRLLM